MSQTIFLRGARHLLTLRGPKGIRRGTALRDLGAIPDGSVLIKDGRILSVGSTRRLENMKEARSALEIPVYGRVLLPGFVDPFVLLTLQRATAKPKRSTEFYDESLALLRSCLQHGTVAARVFAAGDTGELQSDIATLRALNKIGSNPVRLFPAWRLHEAALQWPDLNATAQLMGRRRFAHSIALAAHSGQSAAPSEWLDQLQKSGLPINLLWANDQSSPLPPLVSEVQPGAVSLERPPSLEEVEALQASQAVVVLACGKRILEMNGPHAIRQFVDNGGALALGSGYHPIHSPMYNMQMAIAIAVARLGLTPEEAITAATANAAVVCGCDAEVGTIEVGKQADLVVLNLPDLHNLADHFGTNHVAMVLRNGNIVCNRTKWKPPVETVDRVRRKLL